MTKGTPLDETKSLEENSPRKHNTIIHNDNSTKSLIGVDLSSALRRSPRLSEKFKLTLKNNSEDPIIVDDEPNTSVKKMLPFSAAVEEIKHDRIEVLDPCKTFDAIEYFEELKSNPTSSDDEDKFNVDLEEQTKTKEPIIEKTIDLYNHGQENSAKNGFEFWNEERFENEDTDESQSSVGGNEITEPNQMKKKQRVGCKRKKAENEAKEKERQKNTAANYENDEDDTFEAKQFEAQTNYLDEEELKSFEKNYEDDLQVGMMWGTMQKFRDHMRKHAIFKKFEYKQKVNESKKIIFICKAPTCDWRVHVKKNPHNSNAELRKLQSIHTCRSRQSGENTMASAKWVSENVEESIRSHRNFRPKNIRNEIWAKFGVRISYWVAYH